MHAHGAIDVHAHAFSRAYVDLLEELGGAADVVGPARMVLPEGANDDIEARLAVMDASNVERQILSMSAAAPYLDNADHAARAARFLNDEHAAVCRAHPGRFGFFAALPMPHVDAALAELARAVDDLGADGATFTTSICGRPPSDPVFAPVFDALNRRGSVVFFHPPGFACGSPLMRDTGLSWPLGAPVEDSMCAIHLMQASFPRRYPRLRVILPHLGGVLPFLRYRLDRGADRRFPGDDPPSVQMRKFWYDTANGEIASLQHSVEAYGIDRLLFGTDYPYWTDDSYERAVHYLELAGLTDGQLAAIRHANAGALFTKGSV